MEINKRLEKFNDNFEFKIDLIVWKYVNNTNNMTVETSLK